MIDPTPTDAVLLAPGKGQPNMPANGRFFTTEAENAVLKASLVESGLVPASATFIDAAYALGPVVYGRDGRRVWAIAWHEPFTDSDGVITNRYYEVFAGLLYWRLQELPSGHWRKSDCDVWR